MVRDVQYDPAADNFSVVVKKLKENVVMPAEKFDYVINATGHFSVPNVPEFDGFRKFTGKSNKLFFFSNDNKVFYSKAA